MSRTCAEAVRAHRNLMARLIARRFRRFRLSPYAYQRVLFGGHDDPGGQHRPWLVRLRCFVPDPNAGTLGRGSTNLDPNPNPNPNSEPNPNH